MSNGTCDSLFDISGKIAVVTGGGSGIGLMIAEGLVSRGVQVIIVGRNGKRIADAALTLSASGSCTAIAADVTREEGRRLIVDALPAERRLDILVNAAGITALHPVDGFDADKFDAVLQTNLTALFALTGVLVPALRRAAKPDVPARVVNIASIDAFRLPKWESYAYTASKAALVHLTRHLAKTLASDAITVNAIAPGIFPSRMTRFLFDEAHPYHEPPEHIPLGRTGRPEDIVAAIVYLASRAGAYVTGAVLPVAGGLATAD